MRKIAIVGLGYVGLPLAVEFGKKFSVIGYDINKKRVGELKRYVDKTREVSTKQLKEARLLKFTTELKDVKNSNIFIITVPTPIDEFKQPNLNPLRSATEAVGLCLKKDDIVIYESTVFPGCTEEICVPILEEVSKLKFNRDFYCGYSPERINPGDKNHRLPNIRKVTSGSTKKVAKEIDDLYKEIIVAGTFQASSIRVAEAAKVIENSQRDLNIAFINELSLIFEKMAIDTTEVLEAAATKWNFLPFKPGLVGGHCIGVDPYYLTYKAESLGYHPQVILSGRRINDNMGIYISSKIVKLLSEKGRKIKGSKILMLGVTFKEDCPDIRNSKVIDLVKELQSFGILVDIYDPLADSKEVFEEYGVKLLHKPTGRYNGIVLAVGHSEFRNLKLAPLKAKDCIVYDVKSFLDRSLITARL